MAYIRVSVISTQGRSRLYDKPMLSLEQAKPAVVAMIADYNKDTNRRHKVDMAVVDAGNLQDYVRMDRCLRPTFAVPKGLHRRRAGD